MAGPNLQAFKKNLKQELDSKTEEADYTDCMLELLKASKEGIPSPEIDFRAERSESLIELPSGQASGGRHRLHGLACRFLLSRGLP